MKHLLILTLLMANICLTACSKDYNAPSTNGEDTNALITPDKYAKMLGKGLDVDWWRSGIAGDNNKYNDKAVSDFHNAGITNVRIRFQDGSLSEDDFAILDHQVQLCISHDIVPVIAFAAGDFNDNPTDEELGKVVEWWTAMAKHFSEASDSISFDIIIEPSDAIKKNNDKLNQCYEECVTAIRHTNPKRIIFIAPNHIANPYYLPELKIPTQANGYLMVEWHFYAAGPSKTNATKLWTTGTEEEKLLVTQKIDSAVTWQKANGIYTWVGAWMAGNYNKENEYTVEEQQAFAAFMRKSLERHAIPFSVNADKHFYDYSTNTWYEDMLPLRDAIFK